MLVTLQRRAMERRGVGTMYLRHRWNVSELYIICTLHSGPYALSFDGRDRHDQGMVFETVFRRLLNLFLRYGADFARQVTVEGVAQPHGLHPDKPVCRITVPLVPTGE